MIEGKQHVVTMEVRLEHPPIFDRIVKVFPNAVKPGVLFAFGDIIYNPSAVKIPIWLMRHEHQHQLQQKHHGVEHWWDAYLADQMFRLDQEIAAHQVEYNEWCCQNPKNRNARRVGLKQIAKRLSGPLYGNLISFEEAKRLIKYGAPQ